MTTVLTCTAAEADLIRRLRAVFVSEREAVPDPVSQYMGRWRALIGDAGMERNAGRLRNWFHVDAPAACQVVAELERRVAGGQPIRDPSAYSHFLWGKYRKQKPA